jgi:hypothetical protein
LTEVTHIWALGFVNGFACWQNFELPATLKIRLHNRANFLWNTLFTTEGGNRDWDLCESYTRYFYPELGMANMRHEQKRNSAQDSP